MSGLTPLFSVNDVDQFIQRFQDRAEEKLLKLLQYAGENFIKIARAKGKYQDHTGNLRSSIGYVIVRDGELISGSIYEAEKGTDKKTGVRTSDRLVTSLAKIHNKGLVLIGVAGMEYAVYVEAMEGKDVLSGAYEGTEELLRRSIQRILKL